MILETLGGGLIGGLFRLAPEVLKLLDSKNARAHELGMLQAEMQLATMRGEQEMRRTEASMTIAELDAVSQALKEQGQTARAAGWFVAALSALVRPLVTYWFVTMYSAVKIVGMLMAAAAGAYWQEVLVQHWTEQDMSILMMLLTFWFVGRVYERK
jgi:hypothetical protein